MRPAGHTVLAVFAVAAIGVAAPARIAGAQEQPTATPAEPESGAQTQWLGVTRAELFEKLGKPSQIIEYPDTGGQLLKYSDRGQKHYVFETGPDGRVIRAAVIR